jgi:hypothetical protein
MNGFIIVSGFNTLRIGELSLDGTFRHHITDSSPNMKPHEAVEMKPGIEIAEGLRSRPIAANSPFSITSELSLEPTRPTSTGTDSHDTQQLGSHLYRRFV